MVERHIQRMMHDLRKREAEKRLDQLKKTAKGPEGGPRASTASDWDDDDDDQQYGRPSTRKKKRSKKKPPQQQQQRKTPEHHGTVVTVRKQRCKIALEGELITAWLTADMAAEQKSAIAVGDEVALERRDSDWVVIDVLPRRTTLSRPDPFSPDRERVVAANVDVVVQVSAAKEPPLKIGLIDRYLIAIERGGAEPAICINKIDQADERARATIREELADYVQLEIPMIFCSAETGEGLDELRNIVAGRTAVLVGHSGVGKSSLLTALDERLQLATRELHSGGRSGRHTTTSSTLYDFPDGTRLIDTPGIREFGLFQVDRDDLRFFFEEFEEYARACRYRDCSHLHEPDCAVKSAAEEGNLPRYARYARMIDELR